MHSRDKSVWCERDAGRERERREKDGGEMEM